MIQFSTRPTARLRIATLSGVVDDAELLGAYRDLVAEPGYDPTLNDLVDLRAVERLEVSSKAVRDLVALFSPLDPEGVQTKLAVVAPADYMYGMARMYEILRSEASEQITVFRDYEEAERWILR